jgi:hypothetical protein
MCWNHSEYSLGVFRTIINRFTNFTDTLLGIQYYHCYPNEVKESVHYLSQDEYEKEVKIKNHLMKFFLQGRLKFDDNNDGDVTLESICDRLFSINDTYYTHYVGKCDFEILMKDLHHRVIVNLNNGTHESPKDVIYSFEKLVWWTFERFVHLRLPFYVWNPKSEVFCH